MRVIRKQLSKIFNMDRVYTSYIFQDKPDWSVVPAAPLDIFHWEAELGTANPYRPKSFAALCAVKSKGIFARLWSFEPQEKISIRTQERDGRIWCDSCLELFLQPLCGRAEYWNIEVNPNGVYLSQFGPARENRVFFREITEAEPSITPFSLSKQGEIAWGAEFFVSEALISQLFGINYILSPCTMRGNFYKCGDETPQPHYAAYFPVGTVQLGFHNPARFGKIILNETTH